MELGGTVVVVEKTQGTAIHIGEKDGAVVITITIQQKKESSEDVVLSAPAGNHSNSITENDIKALLEMNLPRSRKLPKPDHAEATEAAEQEEGGLWEEATEAAKRC